MAQSLVLDALAAGYTANEHQLERYEPDFGVQAGFCSGYTELLLGVCAELADHGSILAQVKRSGRIILSDRGGSGKTVFLRRLMKSAADLSFCCIFLDLSRWTEEHSEKIKDKTDDALDLFRFLVGTFSEGGFDTALLEALPPTQDKLILVDGLNETPGSFADLILAACSTAANTYPMLHVLASDRLVRRQLAHESKWSFLHLLELDRNDIFRILERGDFSSAEYELMRSPFFVEQQRRGNLKKSRVQTITSLISEHGFSESTGLDTLSMAAFEIYRTVGSRTFPAARLTNTIDQERISSLLESGILITRPNFHYCFSHHWMHDCLASLHVSKYQALWNVDNRYETLDALTFKRNSFDAVGFVLQLLQPHLSALFLQAVYDWNPYAAGYALSEIESDEDIVAEDIRTVVLAMLALRKLDRQIFTSDKAADALNLFRDEIAIKLRSCDNLQDLKFQIAETEIETELFRDWQAVFCLPVDSIPSNRFVNSIASEDSIIGWTAANIVKHVPLDEAQISSLLELANSHRHAVRWRAVHALGSVSSIESANLLLGILTNDIHKDVRFGAIRSLIEIASSSTDLTDTVIDKLVPELGSLKAQPAVISELENALFVKHGMAVPNWEDKAMALFNALIDKAESVSEIERWSNAASRLRVHGREMSYETA
jgi:hypothetical protein